MSGCFPLHRTESEPGCVAHKAVWLLPTRWPVGSGDGARLVDARRECVINIAARHIEGCNRSPRGSDKAVVPAVRVAVLTGNRPLPVDAHGLGGNTSWGIEGCERFPAHRAETRETSQMDQLRWHSSLRLSPHCSRQREKY